jgi:hypothetical protein
MYNFLPISAYIKNESELVEYSQETIAKILLVESTALAVRNMYSLVICVT